MKKNFGKVIVVGLDGATFDLIYPWVKEGSLPNMGRIMKNGINSRLESIFPPVTPAAWASFMTGKNPGKHGVLDFYLKQNGSYDRIVVNAGHIDGDSLWNILGKNDLKVGVVHVPVTYPPEKVNGFMVSGYPLSPTISTYPRSLSKELCSKFPGYKKIYSDILLVKFIEGMEDSYIERLFYALEMEKEVTFYLMENYEWDFFMTHFYFLDQVQHFLWKYMDAQHPSYDPDTSRKYKHAIHNFYKKIDDILGEILEKKHQDTTLLVMSDHGFGPLYKRVYINHWLRKIGLLKLRESKPASFSGWLSRIGLTRDGLSKYVEKLDLLKIGLKLVPRVVASRLYWALPRSILTLQDIDYHQTKAYSTGYVGQIFINLKGRDPDGIVEPGNDYEQLRTYITKKLYELRDPESGKKLVDKVMKKEEMYSGKYIDQAADLLFIMRDMRYITQGTVGTPFAFGPDLESFIGTPGSITGWHKLNGVLMAVGPNIRKETTLEHSSIIDIVPTLLHIFGIPVPSDMDGHVLKEIFEPDSQLAEKEIQYQVSEKSERKKQIITENEKEEVKKRLKALGYLD